MTQQNQTQTSSELIELAIFPLPVFLLPGGVTRLRIFEQRYIRMVKEAADGRGFALTVFDAKADFNTSPWAAWVKIINFETLPDGLLSIDVQAEKLVKIESVNIESDGLRRGYVSELTHWQDIPLSEDTRPLSLKLLRIFDENPVLDDLYKDTDFDSASWVCKRWLELLPVSMETKHSFVEESTFQQSVHFLNEVVLGSDE